MWQDTHSLRPRPSCSPPGPCRCRLQCPAKASDAAQSKRQLWWCTFWCRVGEASGLRGEKRPKWLWNTQHHVLKKGEAQMTNQHWHQILWICTPVWNHNLFCGHERFTLLSILKGHTLLSYQNSKHKMVHCSNCQLICLQSSKAPQPWQFPPSCVLLLKVSYVHSRNGSHPSTSQTVKGQSQNKISSFLLS